MWALFADKDLTVREMSHAVFASLADCNKLSIDAGTAPSQQKLLESTCYFLSVESDSTIKIHKALRDFCSNLGTYKRRQYFGEVQVELARACLQYIAQPNLRGAYGSKQEWQSRVRDFPFLDYAVKYWGIHLKRCETHFRTDGPDRDLLIDFLQNDDTLLCVNQAMHPGLQQDGLASSDDISPSYAIPGESGLQYAQAEPPMPGLHLLVYFNLCLCVDVWLREACGDVASI